MKLVEQNCNDRSRDNAPPEVGIEAQTWEEKKEKKSCQLFFGSDGNEAELENRNPARNGLKSLRKKFI